MASLDKLMDFEALAVDAEWQAAQANTLHVAALWREFATHYRELGDYYRSIVPANGGPEQPG